MNKEALTEELFCMLEVAARPQDVAGFKRHLESFFIAGAARIDLIGKVMDLDNEIGGHNFDIPLLDETEKTLTNIGKPQGKKCALFHFPSLKFTIFLYLSSYRALSTLLILAVCRTRVTYEPSK